MNKIIKDNQRIVKEVGDDFMLVSSMFYAWNDKQFSDEDFIRGCLKDATKESLIDYIDRNIFEERLDSNKQFELIEKIEKYKVVIL